MRFNPDEYRSVAERLEIARELIQSIATEPPVMMNEVMGYIRCTVAFKDGRYANGVASFRLDAKAGAQRTHPIEDAETSAIGRALAFLGIGSSKSIASREEMYQVSERENLKTAAHISKLVKRANELYQQCISAGVEIDSDLDIPIESMTYDQLIDYGFALKKALGVVR
jgi:hypothetical protein